MLFSHCFGSLETRNRARFWLTWHGFDVKEPRRTAGDPTVSPRLAVHGSYAERAAAQAIIDSIEHSDPHAFASLLDAATPTRWVLDQASDSVFDGHAPHGTPIHFEPREEPAGHAVAARMAEYMFSRWE